MKLKPKSKRLRSQVKKFRSEKIRLSDLEKQLDLTLYDLGIHQEELQAQNEELVKARGNVELLLTKYSILFHDSPIAYLVLDRRKNIIEANQAAASLLNAPKEFLLKKSLLNYINKTNLNNFNDHFRRVFDLEQAADELKISPKGCKSLPSVFQSRCITDTDSGEVG